MNISPNNEKIEKYLEELAEEYKKLLFENLIERSKPLDDLSISELLRLDNEIKKPLFRDYAKIQKRRRVLLITGFTYILLGFSLYLFFMIYDFHANEAFMLMSAIISFSGAFTVAFSFALPMLQLSSNKKLDTKVNYSTEHLEYEALKRWRLLEGIVNDITLEKKLMTSRSAISFLLENNFITVEEFEILKEFLKIRNNIVHSVHFKIEKSTIKKMLLEIDKIIEKIERIL